jgi:UDPglucose 6-dehydrogenase
MKIGIIGLGYVGGSVEHWFKKQKGASNIFIYDKFKKIGSLDEVNRADVIFVAVPTPYIEGKGYDGSAVQESVANIKNGKIIVLKSTIMPRSTEKLQKRYPKKTILFNPEFLRAKTAHQDFVKPERQIIGYANAKGKAAAKKVLALLPRAPYEKMMTSTEAEMVKYFGNAFLATRVIFANQIYDICKAAGINYENVKEGASRDPRVGSSHFDIFADVFGEGLRGYGGPCLPKDVRALLQFAKSVGSETDLLRSMEKINSRLRK